RVHCPRSRRSPRARSRTESEEGSYTCVKQSPCARQAPRKNARIHAWSSANLRRLGSAMKRAVKSSSRCVTATVFAGRLSFMRAPATVVLAVLTCAACGEPSEATDPGVVVREMRTPPRAPASVRCSCDANGDLHVRAPESAKVTTAGPADAEIAFV